MKFTITGSGGFRTLPRPGCDCVSCQDARELSYSRLGASLYLHDQRILFDTPENIVVELNNAGIAMVDHIFYTHWHPDHFLGMRVIEELCTDWAEDGSWRMAPKCRVKVHMPGKVREQAMERYGIFFDFWTRLGIAEMVDDAECCEMGNVKIEHVQLDSRHLTPTRTTIYIISSEGKKVIYAPCDIIPFPESEKFRDADIMILQYGWMGEKMASRARKGPHYEISFEEILDIIKRYKPKRVVLTHIGDEYGLTMKDLRALEEEYQELNIRFAHDGMEIEV